MKISAFRHVLGYTFVVVLAIAGTAQALPGTNTVASDDIINGQVKQVDLGRNAVNSAKVANGTLTGIDIKDHSIQPVDLAKGYYTKAEVNAILSNYVTHAELGSVTGVLRWGYIRDLGSNVVEVYVDNFSTIVPQMSVFKEGTGVYDVIVPGVDADGAWHGIWVTPEQGQTTVFRACKVFQTTYGPTAGTTNVVVRCYDETGALADTDFHILVLQ